MTSSRYGSNSWLISNSSLYFANSVLKTGEKINPYSIFDLSKVSEAILLSEKILTLPGYNNRNDDVNNNILYSTLKENGLIEEIDVSMEDVRNHIFQITRGEDNLFSPRIDNIKVAEIICDIFSIKNKTKVKEFIDNIPSWASENWNSPAIGPKEWLLEEIHAEDQTWTGIRSKHLAMEEFSIENDPEIGELISEIYLRAIMYILVASDWGLTYYPDSVRAPLVSYLHSRIETEIFNYAQEKINQLETKDEEFKKNVNEVARFPKFEIEIPACLSYILKRTDSKKDFINNAFELRESREIRNFRQYLTGCERIIRFEDDPRKILKLKKLDEFLESPTLKQKLIAEGKKNPPFALSNLLKMTINLVPAIRDFFKNSRITFYKKLSDDLLEISSINSMLEAKFGSKLADNQLDHLYTLRGFQENYLNTITSR